MSRIFLNDNVLNLALIRLEWVFNTFDKVCLSFSGGKDSSVLYHLAACVARQKRKTFDVLFIDWEAQFSMTINHIEAMKTRYEDVTRKFYWVALPLTTVNGTSQFQPEWIAWEAGKEWVRQPPKYAITSPNFFPFYSYAMTFEEFVPAFNEWLAEGKNMASLIGIRTEESLNRYMALTSLTKLRFSPDKPWTTASRQGFSHVCYPIYDWKTSDIWLFNTRSGQLYNSLYDLMYQAGVSLKYMRVCEPFGPEQRRGLWLYHVLEPDTWEKMCRRVIGAHSGAIYGNESGAYYALQNKICKPVHYTWQSYALFLLDNMPQATADHYRNKLAVYLRWYQTRGFPDGIPDEQEKDLNYRDIPSWRRICKTIIKNDFWCKTLSFSPTKPRNYERYCQRLAQKRAQWRIL